MATARPEPRARQVHRGEARPRAMAAMAATALTEATVGPAARAGSWPETAAPVATPAMEVPVGQEDPVAERIRTAAMAAMVAVPGLALASAARQVGPVQALVPTAPWVLVVREA